MLSLIGEITLWAFAIVALACCLRPRKLLWHTYSYLPAVSFAILLYGFIAVDTSLQIVADSAAVGDELIFRIASTWANHQGSLLLWLTMIVTLGGIVGHLLEKDNRDNTAFMRYCSFLGFLLSSYIILISSPFEPATNKDIMGLNPLLHDHALTIHPPILFFGYAATAVVAALGFAILKTNKPDAHLLNIWRLSTLLAWSVLTAGIGLGSWWAYRELGWGGWWFWDPVENASLLPWLVLTALLHSFVLMKKHPQFLRYGVIYSFLAWSLCLLGTFLVRSGLLISVHSFAVDSARGVMLLIMIFAHTTFIIQNWRTQSGFIKMSKKSLAFLISIQNYFLLSITALVAVGLFYPFFSEYILKTPVSVGASFYNQTVLPLFAVIMATLVFLPFFYTTPKKNIFFAVTAIIFTIIIIYLVPLNGLAMLWAVLPATLFSSIIIDNNKQSSPAKLFGHLSLPLFCIAVLGYGYNQSDQIIDLQINTPFLINNKTITLRNISQTDGDIYIALNADIDIVNGNSQSTITVQKRLYKLRQTVTSEMTIISTWQQDTGYLLLSTDGKTAQIRIHNRPMMRVLWLSWAMMTLGGIMAFTRKSKIA